MNLRETLCFFSGCCTGLFRREFMKKYSKDENPVVDGYQFIMGGIAMVLIGIVFGGRSL